MDPRIIEIEEAEEAGIRLDRYLTEVLPDYSRSYLQNQIKEGNILVNDRPVKVSYHTRMGDEIRVADIELREPEIAAEDIPLSVLYEDDDVILVDKPKGMVVHPAPGHMSGTLVNALMYHCRDSLSGINGILRPGIVHRIDKDTTGVIIACKNDRAHRIIAEQLKEHSITRKYHAIVWNTLAEDGTVDAPIGRNPSKDPAERKKMAIDPVGGRRAVTHYHVLENLGGKCAYVECQLETGRTHQIRVHMASIGHPLLGDPVYGKRKEYQQFGQVLHAKVFGFIHPTTGEYMEFEAPLPPYFTRLLQVLR
ncbi:MAG: RluA family pseudouridine synthase [Lachnospiraceae bacterium]|nr:RluA family pseudouridine synthase [Lachnospiraceae bacterium]